ncbi:MAG: DUF4293 family protein [Bacteroidetes bacterium]|nr:DUF4293 family protein [Bacteroidota bacterium]
MFQRWQTLFMTGAIIAWVMLFLYPVSDITEITSLNSQPLETDYYQLFITGIHDPSPVTKPQMSSAAAIPMLVLLIMMTAVTAWAISRFKTRLYQLKLVKSAIFLNIILVAGIFLNYPGLFIQTTVNIDPAAGAYFPLISLVLLVVAHRYILKDEKLVRSSDRLR